jgi:hypothetical protein
MAVIFAMLPTFLARFAAAVLSMLYLLPLSAMVFKQGMWLDFAVPLLAVELHGMLSDVESGIAAGRRVSESRTLHSRSHVPVWAKLLTAVLVAIGIVLLWAASPRASEPQTEIGYISGYENEAMVRWVSDTGAESLQPLKPVLDGDRFEFLDDSARVTVVIGDTTRNLSRATVGADAIVMHARDAREPLAIERVLSFLVSVADPTPRHAEEEGVAAAAVRETGDGAILEVPVLRPDNQQLIAGKRSIALAWQASHKPVRVVHEDPNGNIVFDDKSDDCTEQWIATLEPGVHLIQLTDSAGRTIESHVRVVDPSLLPARILSPNTHGSEARHVLDALRLATDPSELWRLEAYLRVTTSDGVDGDMNRLRRMLEHGDRIVISAKD